MEMLQESKKFIKYICWLIIQGDQNVSVHLMITIQKVTSSVQSFALSVFRHLLTCRTVFSKTVFNIALRYHGKWLKRFKIFLYVFCIVITRCTETFRLSCIKSVLWRVAVRLSYIQDAQYLKVNYSILLFRCGVLSRHCRNSLQAALWWGRDIHTHFLHTPTLICQTIVWNTVTWWRYHEARLILQKYSVRTIVNMRSVAV
jgi:hypothetical protein